MTTQGVLRFIPVLRGGLAGAVIRSCFPDLLAGWERTAHEIGLLGIVGRLVQASLELAVLPGCLDHAAPSQLLPGGAGREPFRQRGRHTQTLFTDAFALAKRRQPSSFHADSAAPIASTTSPMLPPASTAAS